MSSEIPLPVDQKDQKLYSPADPTSSEPVNAIFVPENVRQFYDATIEIQDLSKQLNNVAHRLESSFKTTRFHVLGWFVVLLFYPLVMIAASTYMPGEWKLKTVELMMGTENAWEAGQSILSKVNNERYSQTVIGYSIVSDNLRKVEGCVGIAKTLKRPIECALLIDPIQENNGGK